MAAPPAEPTRGRRVAFTAAMLALPALFFVVLEGGLRVAEYGEDLPLFIPVQGAPEWLVQNPQVARRYFSRQARVPTGLGDAFRARKDTAAYRIFVLGGSSAAGYPYYFGGAFSRMLQQRLQQTFPGRRIEVVNTGLAAINSYALVDFSREILGQAPDAILVYAGHNEYYGALGVASSESIGRSRTLVRAYLALQRFRTVQLLRSGLARLAALGASGAGSPPGRTLMERMVGEQRIPAGSPLFRAGVEQFRGNLRTLLARFREAGVPVYVATLVSNERDHAPFVSGPSAETDPAAWRAALDRAATLVRSGADDRALAVLDSLVLIDSTDAQVHFVRGRLLDRAGDSAGAARTYRAARNLDQLRFRAPDAMNAVIREESERAGAGLVDVEGAFRAESPGGIVDGSLMLEHLHPNLDGYLLLADAFYRALEEDGRIGDWRRRVPLGEARYERLVTVVDSLYGAFRLRQLLGSWPFQAPGTFDRSLDTLSAGSEDEALALALHRDRMSWFQASDRLWRRYVDEGELHRALRTTLAMVQQYPFMAGPYVFTGDVLVRQGRLPEALAYYGAASDLEDSAVLRGVMGDVWMLMRRPSEAIPSYERAAELDPTAPDFRLKLAQAHLATGDTVRAGDVLRRLLDMVPDEPRARRALAMLGLSR